MSKKVYHITEQDKYMPPSSMDLITIADTSGTRLMNMYNELENIKVSYPASSSKIDPFVTSSIIPINDKIKSLIQKEIPELETKTSSKYKGDTSAYSDLGYVVKTIKDKATVDILIRLKTIDKEVTELQKKVDSLKSSISTEYQGSEDSKSFEDSVKKIIDKVRAGIVKQAEQNIRNKKRGDIIAGTTDLGSTKGSGAASTGSPAITINKKKNIDGISAYLAKKYSM
jgi:hypothetical protein